MSNPKSSAYTFGGHAWGGGGQENSPVYGQGFSYPWYGGWYAQGAGYGPGVPGEGSPGASGGYGPSADGVGSTAGATAGPYVGVGPQGYKRSDERIAEDVNERLMQRGYLDARNSQVSVQDGEVTLTGSVDSRQAKRLATDIADGVPGVQDVYNRLSVAAV